jgi:hypothetical protein
MDPFSQLSHDGNRWMAMARLKRTYKNKNCKEWEDKGGPGTCIPYPTGWEKNQAGSERPKRKKGKNIREEKKDSQNNIVGRKIISSDNPRREEAWACNALPLPLFILNP